MGTEASDPVVEWYAEHVAEPEEATDIYLGFAVFVAGIGLGLVGLVVFLVEGSLINEELYWLREIAFALGALGLPALLVGVVTLLPGDRRVLAVSAAGGVVTLASVALFVWAYPYNWNVSRAADYSNVGVAVYAVGLIGVIGAAGSALVTYHVQQATAEGAPAPTDAEPETGPTDEEVTADIEAATENADLTWGGVPETRSQRLEFTDDPELDATNMEIDPTTRRDSGQQVDDAVAGLGGMKGDIDRTDRGGSTDDETDRLAALKQKQQEASEMPQSRSLWARLRSWVRLRF